MSRIRNAELREHNGRKKIFVDGRPFLVLGIQIDFRTCADPADFDRYFEPIEHLGCNTVFFALRWSVLEPGEGTFEWKTLDHAMERCRERGLKMSLLWFVFNQGGASHSVPAWVRDDRTRFRRVRDRDGKELEGLCPSNAGLQQAEFRAFRQLIGHLETADPDGTVIMMQLENEICIRMDHDRTKDGKAPFHEIWLPRCMCAECSRGYRDSGLPEWEFGVRSLTSYVNGLLDQFSGPASFLTYVNFPVNPLRPGEDIDLYLEECPKLDLVAPDYYGFSDQDLAFTMRYFSRGRNVPFIAEHSTELDGEADRNLYLAVCGHACQGFDPWAIDTSFGWHAWRDGQKEPPFVDKEGRWSQMAGRLARAQKSLKRVLGPVAAALGSDMDTMHYVGSKEERKIEEKRWGIHWVVRSGEQGKWLCVRREGNAIFICGDDTVFFISVVNGDALLNTESGVWTGDHWVPDGKVSAVGRALEFRLEEGRSFRVRIARN